MYVCISCNVLTVDTFSCTFVLVKIEYENFKDTKKINIFIAIVFFVTTMGSASVSILFLVENEPDGYVVLTVCLLILPTACQLVLFLPKILPTILSGIRNIKNT